MWYATPQVLAQVSQSKAAVPSGVEGERESSMRKMLCEIDLQKAQGYPVRYLESRPAGEVKIVQ